MTDPEASPVAEHLAIGMFSVESDAGGAVWTFRDDDVVRLIGPGQAFALGGWSAPDGDHRGFSGSIEVELSDQTLTFKGEASTDGSAIALLVTATEPGFDAGKFNWPPESRLVGKRVGFRDVEPGPSPSPDASAGPMASPSSDAGAQPVPSVLPAATPASLRAEDGECVTWDGIEWGACEV